MHAWFRQKIVGAEIAVHLEVDQHSHDAQDTEAEVSKLPNHDHFFPRLSTLFHHRKSGPQVFLNTGSQTIARICNGPVAGSVM